MVYHELVLTAKEYMRHCTAIRPEWLAELAPHYYARGKAELGRADPARRRLPRAPGKAPPGP